MPDNNDKVDLDALLQSLNNYVDNQWPAEATAQQARQRANKTLFDVTIVLASRLTQVQKDIKKLQDNLPKLVSRGNRSRQLQSPEDEDEALVEEQDDDYVDDEYFDDKRISRRTSISIGQVKATDVVYRSRERRRDFYVLKCPWCPCPQNSLDSETTMDRLYQHAKSKHVQGLKKNQIESLRGFVNYGGIKIRDANRDWFLARPGNTMRCICGLDKPSAGNPQKEVSNDRNSTSEKTKAKNCNRDKPEQRDPEEDGTDNEDAEEDTELESNGNHDGTIQCEGCGAFQHKMCMSGVDKAPFEYFCERCSPEDHTQTQNAIKNNNEILVRTGKAYLESKSNNNSRKRARSSLSRNSDDNDGAPGPVKKQAITKSARPYVPRGITGPSRKGEKGRKVASGRKVVRMGAAAVSEVRDEDDVEDDEE